MGLTFGETVGVAVVTAGLTWAGQAIMTALLLRRNERDKYLREKLLERYAEFAATVAVDIDRARSMQSAGVFQGASGDEERIAQIRKLEVERHDNRRVLMKLSVQIRLLETNPSLSDLVGEMAKEQPFQPGITLGKFSEKWYNDLFDSHQKQIDTFTHRLDELTKKVVEVHAVDQVKHTLKAALQLAMKTKEALLNREPSQKR